MRLARSFWLFLASTALTNLGDGIRLAALPLLAASLTDDPLLVAAVAAAGTLPWVVAGLHAGALADRHAARRLLLAADTGRVVVLLALVLLVAADRAGVVHVALAAFLLGVGETVRDTTCATVVPRLVPGPLLERANGRLFGVQLVADEFAGPLVGAALFTVGAAVPFVLTGGATALGVLLLLLVPTAVLTRAVDDARPPPGGLLAGLPVLRGSRLLRVLLATTALVALADGAWYGIFVLFVDQRLGAGEATFGALLAVGAVGGLAGSLAVDRLVAGRGHRAVVAASAAVAGVAPVLLVVVEEVWAAAVVTVATSAAFGVFNVTVASLRQRLTPDGLLGRVTATWRIGSYGAGTAGALGGGALAQVVGLSAPFVLSAAVGVLATVLFLGAAGRVTPPPPRH